MAIPRKNRVRIEASTVSAEVAEYVRYLKGNKFNASQEIDDALRAMPGFKKWLKEKENGQRNKV